MHNKGKGLHMLTFLLLVIGGLNWLLYALFNWEIGMLFGDMNNVVARVIYILVGLSAIYELATHKSTCAACGARNSSEKPSPPTTQPPTPSQSDHNPMSGGHMPQ